MARDIIDITEIAQKRVEVVSSTLTYIGYSRTNDPETSDPVWQISRITIQGTETITEYADRGNFTQIWDNRDSLFPEPVFFNSLSTSFDGVNELLDGGDIHSYDVNSAWSLSMWVKPNNIAASRILFSKAGVAPNIRGYMLRHNATTGQLFLQMRTSTVNRSHTFNSALTAGVWQHVMFTYNGGGNMNGIKVYLDGVLDSNLPGSASLTGTLFEGQSFQLGSRNSGFYYVGNMDEVTIWNKELSASEVTELYNAGSPLAPTSHSAVGNLASWYRMGDGDTHPTVSDNQGSDDLTMQNMDSGNFAADVP